MGMSEFYGPRDDDRALRTLAAAVERGMTFLDTADMYGSGHNEELIGRFLAGSGADVRVATKFGILRRPGEYARTIDNDPTYARAACDASLKRLGVERIDLYYVHRIESGRPIEEVMGALAELVAEGKIAHVGLCEPSAGTLRRTHAVHPVAAVQSEWSLWTRDIEAMVLPTCRELGVGLVPYAPLGRGFLAGAFDAGSAPAEGDIRASLPRFTPAAAAANRRLVDLIREVATDHGATPAQVALAWVLARGADVAPIFGTTRPERLIENLAALDLVLDATAMARLDAALSEKPVIGDRYAPEGMKGLGG